MLTEFQRTKLATRFQQLDVDGNGYIEQADFDTLAQRLSDRITPAEHTEDQAEIKAGYQELWRLLSSEADYDGDGRISQDEYTTAMETGVLADPQKYEASVGRIARALFSALDADDSELLDLAELMLIGEAYELAAEDIEAMFQALDADRDGAITQEEFLAAVRDFYYSDDPESAGRLVFAVVA